MMKKGKKLVTEKPEWKENQVRLSLPEQILYPYLHHANEGHRADILPHHPYSK